MPFRSPLTPGSIDPSPAGWGGRVTICCSLSLLLCFVFSVGALAEGTIYDYASDGRMTRMWVPDDLPTIRGLAIYGNPAGGDARYYVGNNALRGFARLHGFAVIATAYFGYLQGSEISIWEAHLGGLAILSGHGEIAHAPWAPLGFSNGGQMSYGFNALRPEKVIGFVANKGGYYNDPLPAEAALRTPGILVAGELDTEYRRTVIRTLFQENRARGALWAWVEEQGMGHEGDDERLFLPFLHETVRLRYPPNQAPTESTGVHLIELVEEDGWLVDPATWGEPLTFIAPHDEYPGDPLSAGWLPSPSAAYHYRAFATRTDWLVKGGGGSIVDRPLYIEVPVWDEYWWRSPGAAPSLQHVRIDTREYPRWTRVEVFSGETLVGLAVRDGEGQDSVAFDISLDDGVHGLSALVTDLDGMIRTTGIRHRVVLPAPSPTAVSQFQSMECELRIAGTNPSAGPIDVLYAVDHDGEVELSVFDVQGRQVTLLERGPRRVGSYSARWSPGSVPPGVYFIRVETVQESATRQVVLIR